MSWLAPCPGCGRNRKADEGHHLCRECEGYPAHTDTAARLVVENDNLRAERDTLAEIVAIISPRVERDAYGLGIVAGRNFYADSRWTEADGERFRAVLDRIYREAETDD